MKSAWKMRLADAAMSLPSRGAWIEMDQNSKVIAIAKVAPLAGGVD